MNWPIIRRIVSYMRPYWAYIAGALVCAVISIALSLLGPVLVGRAIDHILGPGNVDFSSMLKVLFVLALSIVLSSAFQWAMTLFTNRIVYHSVRDLRREVFGKWHAVPLKYIDTHARGDLLGRMVNDVDQVSDGMLAVLTQLFTGIVTILGTLCFMLAVNWIIALVVVVLTPLSFFVAGMIAKYSSQKFREQMRLQGKLSAYVEEHLQNQRLVKAFSFESQAQQGFDDINRRLQKTGVKAQFYSSLVNPSTRFVNGVVYAAVGVSGALLAIYGRLSIGQLSSFLSYANQYTKPFNEISGVVTQLQSALASAQRIFEVLDASPEPADPEDAIVLQNCRGNVTLRHVCFSYDPRIPLIDDLNLEAKAGQKVAIVGPTGCGKTTLINLLMRFYEVTAGEILIDGVSTRQMARNDLRGLFGMVLQDTWLYGATVRENIAYSNPDATEEQIVAAAKEAHAHGFITRLPQGYDTVIDEDGGNLSQGQKQLLCIARVMLINPPILILDEATSNIDTRTELRVQAAFSEMMEGRTSFIVAHRLSTIENADQIVVMKDGHILQQGTHRQLLESGGFYASLYHSQFQQETGKTA